MTLKKGKGLDNNFCSWQIIVYKEAERKRKRKKRKKMKANTYEDYCTEKLDTTPSQK